MHIAVFLQHYHTPDCPTAGRPYALVERLSRDHDVTLITTRAWEQARLANHFPWTPPGVHVVRFDVPYSNAMSTGQRLIAYFRYMVRAILYGLRMPRPDLILGSSSPLTAAMAAALVASVRRVPWIFEVRDLWPDFPIQMGALPWSGLQKILYRLEALLYRSASHVVTLSPDMEEHVHSVAPSVPVTTNEYGTDLDLVSSVSEDTLSSLRKQFSLDGRYLVLYAGTFGRANAIPTLLTSARQLADRSDVLVAVAGRGYHEPAVRRAARRHAHIRKIPPLPYPTTLALFRLADLSLVPFLDRPVLAANSPGKFFDSLATGTPVLVTNRGWTKRFVERHDCGWYCPPESPDALATQVRALLDAPDRLERAGQNAQTVAHRRFNRSELMEDYAALVSETVEATPRRSVS